MLTLNALIEIADKYYGDRPSLTTEAWDFEKSAPQPEIATTALRYYICSELRDTFNGDRAELDQLGVAITAMKMAKNDLNDIQAGLEQHLVWSAIRDFWEWLKQSKRQFYTPGILNSWIEVHPMDIVRDVGNGIKRAVYEHTPLPAVDQIAIDPELVLEMDTILASKLRVKPEEPKPAVETPPTAPTVVAPLPTT